MFIWKISQSVVQGYDTFDSAVIVAATWKLARHTHPKDRQEGRIDPVAVWTDPESGWCKDPKDVMASCVGAANADQAPGVICASFNAG